MGMPVTGPVDQAAVTALGLGAGTRVGAGRKQAAVLPDIDPRQAANPNPRPGNETVRLLADRARNGGERPAERSATPFLAQLLAQESEPRSTVDQESQRLAGRRQAARLVVEDPAAEAQRRRAVTRSSESAEASAGAYDRVKLSAREFAARRYGVARDADGTFFFQASSIDINA